MLFFRRIIVIAVSLSLIVLVLWFSGVKNVLAGIVQFPMWATISILMLFGINLFVVSFRFWRILAHFGIILPWRVASRASMSGHAAGLFMISLFGQVVGRQAILRGFAVKPIVIAALAAYERAVLTIVGGGLCVFGAAYLIGELATKDFLGRISLVEIAIVAICGGGLSIWLGYSNFEAKLAANGLSWRNLGRVIEIVSITFIGVILTLLGFVVGIYAIQPNINLTQLFAAASVISFASAMPISVGGWGVRELAAIYILGKLGISNVDAVTVSIMVGLCSTLVILFIVPFSVKSGDVLSLESPKKSKVQPLVDIEKVAAWIVGMTTAVAVFFQAHIPLSGGVVNLNLADPFAILALAATVLHFVFARELPEWRMPSFNMVLWVFSLLLLFGFLRGWMEIGITQWALGGRLIGWLVLLGYLSAGYLVSVHAGNHGLRRFAETIIATAATIVFVQMGLRLLDLWGLNPGVYLASNFEGYAGNRNAFAFQLLTAIALFLGYTTVYQKHRKIGVEFERLFLVPLLLGLLLVGVVWSGSRAGIGVAALLLCFGFSRKCDRKILLFGMLGAFIMWFLVWVMVSVAQGSDNQNSIIQSAFSGDYSDNERWSTFIHAFDLWRKSPLIGVGLGVFMAKSVEWLGHPQVIHSTPFWIAAEFGLVGVVTVGWMGGVFARYLWISSKFSPACRSLLFLLIIFSIFGLVHEIFYQRIFWLVLGALLAKPFLITHKPQQL